MKDPGQCGSVGWRVSGNVYIPVNGNVMGPIPSQGTHLGCKFIQSRVWAKREATNWSMFLFHISVSLPLSLSPFPSL